MTEGGSIGGHQSPFPRSEARGPHAGSSSPCGNDLASIWLNGRFVSIEEYHNFQSKSYQQKTDRITAYVQPIFTGVKGTIFRKHGYVFGCNENPSSDACGKIIRKIVCSDDNSHPFFYKHEYCNDPGCPTCHPKFASRIADAVTKRVMGYRSVFGFDPVYHLIFWPEYREGYANLKEAFGDAKRLISQMGAKMAVVWYHPFRIPDEIKEQLRRYKRTHMLDNSIGFWKMAHDDVLGLGCLDAYVVPGPHFHAVASGYLMNTLEYAKLKMGGYKKVRVLDSEEELHRVGYYISTHACREATKSTVRYFGKISYSKLTRDEGIEVTEERVCEICGKPLYVYYCNEQGEASELAHNHYSRKVMHYRYWKRGDKPPGLRKTRQEIIWGPF
jgi:hypothetical protein